MFPVEYLYEEMQLLPHKCFYDVAVQNITVNTILD